MERYPGTVLEQDYKFMKDLVPHIEEASTSEGFKLKIAEASAQKRDKKAKDTRLGIETMMCV